MDSKQNFTVNSDGTVSPDDDTRYVLASFGYNSKRSDGKIIGWVLKNDNSNRLIFENAQEILGVSETHG